MRKISRRDASRFHEPQKITIAYFVRSEEHTSELQSQSNLVCRLLLEKKKTPAVTQTILPPASMLPIIHRPTLTNTEALTFSYSPASLRSAVSTVSSHVGIVGTSFPSS